MLKNFWKTESGAITVDWVTMTAGIVGLGLASTAAVRTGVVSLGSDVDASLSGASVSSLRFNFNEVVFAFGNGIAGLSTRNPNGDSQIAWSNMAGPDGEPGVMIFTDRIGDATWVSMGDAMTGDQSDKYGGSLSFDLNLLSRNGNDYDPNAMVQITGANGVVLTYDPDSFPPTGEWTSYSASMTAGSWRLSNGQLATEDDIRAVLADVADTEIRTEFINGGETVLLDNVHFN